MTVLLFSLSSASAQQKPSTVDSTDIVGFQRRPKIFLEFETHSPTMDSIIFKRDDFDRSLLEDAKTRLRAQVPEKKK
jgi:hypothetical protein